MNFDRNFDENNNFGSDFYNFEFSLCFFLFNADFELSIAPGEVPAGAVPGRRCAVLGREFVKKPNTKSRFWSKKNLNFEAKIKI